MKYMGSKSRIARHIVPIIQHYIDHSGAAAYIEPFVGGANVIDKVSAPGRHGTDINPYLIALLSHVQHGRELPESVSFEQYSEVRADKARFPAWYVGCVGFLASYNGRFFDGGYAKPGYEGTKFRDYYRESKRNIEKQAAQLKGIEFACKDYRWPSGPGTFENSVIYCDPPYAGTKQYANSENFDYNEFWNTVRRWSRKNVVLVSEHAAPDDFTCIWEQPVLRTIDSVKRVPTMERLFLYNRGRC
jgi:DNA adenine methylase